MLSSYLEKALLDHVLHGITYSPPEELYVALFTSDGEVSGGSYQRQPATFTDAAEAGGRTTVMNDVDLTFEDMPSVTITEAAIMDADAGGNELWRGFLGEDKSIGFEGDPVIIQAGELVVGLE